MNGVKNYELVQEDFVPNIHKFLSLEDKQSTM